MGPSLGRGAVGLGEPGRVQGSRFSIETEENGVWSVVFRELCFPICFKAEQLTDRIGNTFRP